jgi:hypothetical protein
VSKGRRKLGHVQRVPGGTNDYEQGMAAEMLPATVVEAEDLDNPAARERQRAFRMRRGEEPVISRRPHLDEQLKSAHTTIFLVLKRIEENAVLTRGDLADEDLRAFVKVAGDVLPKIIREERELTRAEKLEEMDQDELLRLAEEAREVLTKD